MKKTTNLGLILVLFGLILLACSKKSDDYEPPSNEEESAVLDQNQVATDSISALNAKTQELDN
ncbi:MAG: hypothetical protein R2819_11255 [Allomuricauda sp.]